MTSRRRKRPLPDWVGEAYNDKNTNSEPGDSIKNEVVSDKHVNYSSSVTSGHSVSASISKSGKIGQATYKTHAVTRKGSNKDEPLSAEEIIRMSLPLLKFEGSLIYSYNCSDCSALCEDLLSSLSSDDVWHVGFDMEWPVAYTTGANNQVALIQVCTAENKCYLFHIAAMGTFPKALKTFLSDSRIIKYGINIESDFWKLERDFDGILARKIIRESAKDLSKIANVKLKSSERWNLDGLTRNVLRQRLDKDGNVRCGKWDQYPLSEEQIQYAAADAYAGFLLAKKLCDK